MKRCIHIVPSLDDVANGMARVARFLAKEQGHIEVVDLKNAMFRLREGSAGVNECEVWVHGMWLPKEWMFCWRILREGKCLVRMTHGSLSPVYLKCQSRWKKWLVGPIERYFLRRCDRIIATCKAEKEWIDAYVGNGCQKVEIVDMKKFFKLEMRDDILEMRKKRQMLHLLYLGRRHPLKGVEFLEAAVNELNHGVHGKVELRIVSDAFGEKKEKVWEWCDVLVLPTLSENFGLVVAEALERGKRVITTDGAPVWGEGLESGDRSQKSGITVGYGGRLLYLNGYRDGKSEKRIEMLKMSILKVLN